jgi:2-polyprenyl-3-methyl-5-hydroxy-6-metoxy-1,4-benzoquinol methylase
MIRASKRYEAYWDRSEQAVLARFERHVGAMGADALHCLDAGCGDGRLLPTLSRLFARVSAIEPDLERCAAAQRCVDHHDLANVDLRALTIEDLPDAERYDIIVCSHVVQHVPLRSLDTVLACLSRALSPGGVMLVMTCHSTDGTDRFVRSFLRDGKTIEEDVAQAQFDALFDEEGVLPIHFFTRDSLQCLAKSHGLGFGQFGVFHLEKSAYPLWLVPNADRLVNCVPALQRKHGRDLWVFTTHE